ncbi:hypothetical protein Hanom_Chr05g00453161 [Helianthus anomalus]
MNRTTTARYNIKTIVYTSLYPVSHVNLFIYPSNISHSFWINRISNTYLYTNRQPDVATNLLISQSTERAPGPNIRDDHRPISLVNESIDSSCKKDNKSTGNNRA